MDKPTMDPLFPIPPRPKGGYPASFFDSWPTSDARVWAHWMRSYHEATGGDPHNDFGRWLEGAGEPVSPGPMQHVSVRLPLADVVRAKAEGKGRPDGFSGVIRQALAEHWGEAS